MKRSIIHDGKPKTLNINAWSWLLETTETYGEIQAQDFVCLKHVKSALSHFAIITCSS